MKNKFIWLVGSVLMVLALLVSACAPAPEKEAAPAAPAVFTNIGRNNTHKNMIMSSLNLQVNKLVNMRTNRIESNLSVVTDHYPQEVFWKVMELYFDRPARAKVLREAWLYFWEQSWFISLLVPEISQFWQPCLKGYYGFDDYGIYDKEYQLRYAWIDQELKKAMGY